ncbi:unnamed protein product [Caenorhabditis angaria]|uniref:Uncharacterized protein n=1 Tax=Caenorhabditis angaria TaxID=860376 RepID=A0A9P1I5G9_9PELO|nr:unnamed protein product [Caenorhabditis angaria]
MNVKVKWISLLLFLFCLIFSIECYPTNSIELQKHHHNHHKHHIHRKHHRRDLESEESKTKRNKQVILTKPFWPWP